MIFCAKKLNYHTFEKTAPWYPKPQQKQQKQHFSKMKFGRHSVTWSFFALSSTSRHLHEKCIFGFESEFWRFLTPFFTKNAIYEPTRGPRMP